MDEVAEKNDAQDLDMIEKEDTVTAATVDIESRSQTSAFGGHKSLADVSSTIS